MKQYINFPILSSRSYERLGWLLALGAAIVAVLIVVWLSPVELGHVVLGLVASVALFGTVVVWRKKSWKKFKLRLPQRQDVSPEISTTVQYYSREELSPVTIKYSGLSERELEKVLYDEHHHWVVTLAMIFYPFWSRDYDIQPRVANAFAVAQSGLGNKMLMGTIRTFTHLMQVLYALFLVVLLVGTILRSLGVSYGGFAVSGAFITVTAMLLAVVTVAWVLYMRRVSRGCRLIITEWNIILLVHQLPWRNNTRPILQYALYASSDPQQSLVGKLLRYIDLSISTTDPEDPLPGWIKARNPKRLKAVMAYWDVRKRTEQERKYAELSRLDQEASMDDTQEIPVVLF